MKYLIVNKLVEILADRYLTATGASTKIPGTDDNVPSKHKHLYSTYLSQES